MAQLIWSRPENPPDSVARSIGITVGEFHERLHKIKREAGLGARQRVRIYDDGTIEDETHVWIGNVKES
jgi:hypothetical protein